MKITFKSNGKGGWNTGAKEAELLKSKLISKYEWELASQWIPVMFGSYGRKSPFDVYEAVDKIVYVVDNGKLTRAAVVKDIKGSIMIYVDVYSPNGTRVYIEDGDVLYTEKEDYIADKAAASAKEKSSEKDETSEYYTLVGTMIGDLLNQFKNITETVSENSSEPQAENTVSEPKVADKDKENGESEETLESIITKMIKSILDGIEPKEEPAVKKKAETTTETPIAQAFRQVRLDNLKEQLYNKKKAAEDVEDEIAKLNEQLEELKTSISDIEKCIKEIDY